jgi:hypothetical protein
MRGWISNRIVFATGVWLLVPLCACTSSQLIQETVKTLDTLGRQQSERRSFLGTTTEIFYPNGVPDHMSDLPLLDASQVARIQADLERQSKLLTESLSRNTTTMSAALGLNVSAVGDQEIDVDQNYAATAALQLDGSILIDLKVVQGVFRGVLLSVIKAPGDGLPSDPGTPTEKEQKDALQIVLAAREAYLSAPAVPTVQALKEVRKARKSGAQTLEEIGSEVLDLSLQNAGAASISMSASRMYDDALAFIIAHELGHRALNHFDRLARGESRSSLELEADRFGSLLVTLQRNANVTPNWGYNSPPPGRAYYQILGSKICLDDHNYKPAGHVSFFRYGYQLSGFDSLGGDAKEYPAIEKRLEVARRTTAATHQYIDLAQEDLGTCYPDKERQRRAKTHPELLFDEHFNFFKKELGKMDEWRGLGWSEEDLRERQTRLEDNSSDLPLSKSVYMNFVSRMSSFR